MNLVAEPSGNHVPLPTLNLIRLTQRLRGTCNEGVVATPIAVRH